MSSRAAAGARGPKPRRYKPSMVTMRLLAPAGVECEALEREQLRRVVGVAAGAAAHRDDHLRRQLDERLVGKRTEAVDRRRHVLGAGEPQDRIGAGAWPPTTARPFCTASTNRARSGFLILAVRSASSLKSASTCCHHALALGLGADRARDQPHLGGDARGRMLVGDLDVGHARGLERLDDLGRARALRRQDQRGIDGDHALARQRAHVADALLLLERLRRELARGVDADDARARAQRVDDLGHVPADREDARRICNAHDPAPGIRDDDVGGSRGGADGGGECQGQEANRHERGLGEPHALPLAARSSSGIAAGLVIS